MAYLTRLLSVLLGLLCFTAAAHAEPVSGIIGLIASFVTSYGAAIAAVVSVASSAYASSQAKKKARQAAARKAAEDMANLRDRTATLVSAEAPWATVYGAPARIGGAVVAVLDSGQMAQFKHVVMVFASHECEAIDEIFIEGTSVGRPNEFGWTDGAEFQMPPLFTGWPSEGPAVNVQFHTSPGGVDTADAFLRWNVDQTFPGANFWTEQHKLSGCTYAVVTLNMLFERFQGGLPEITARLRGKKVYDPRTGQTAYSRNPALCLADFLRSETGYLAATDQIDENALIAAANACDQEVYGAVDAVNYGNSRALYVCDGMFRSDQDRESTRQQLEDAMAGFSLESGGVWRIQAGAWSTPVLNLTDDDMLAPTAVVQTANPGTSRFNGMRGTYVNAARNGVSEDFTPYQNPTFRALDAKDKFTDMALAFTTSHVRCHQIARVVVEQSRGGFVLRIHPKMLAWHLQPGDRIVLTSALYGFANKTFRVQDWTYARNAPLSLLVIEDVPAYYDLADEVQADAAPNTNLPSPFLQPQAPLDLQVQSGEEQLVQQGGTLVVRAKVSWSPSTEPAVVRNGAVRVEWRSITPVGEWQSMDLPGDAKETYLLGLAVHSEYQVRVRFLTPYAVSSWTTVTHRLQGPSEFPDDVAGLSLAVESAGVIARWSAPAGLNLLDWGATQIRVGASWETAIERFTGKAQSANIGWLNTGTQKVWAAHANTQGVWGIPVAATIDILQPAQPIVRGEVWGAQIELAWQPCGTTQPIAAYIVKVGPTLAQAVEIGRTSSLNFARTEPVAATRIYWVVAFDAASNAGDAGYVELASLPSIDDAIKELQEGLDEQVADLLNVNSGISERLIDEAIERGTAITHVEKVVTDTAEQLAQRIDTVSARAVGYVRANLVFNGGFEFALDKWELQGNAWDVVEDDWGASARLQAAAPAAGRLASASFPARPGTWYAGSGDAMFLSDVGQSGFALEFFDAAGTSLGVTSNLKAGRHGFMNEQLRRNDFAVEALAPAAAVTGKVTFLWSDYVAGGGIGIRFVKVEQGRFPVTPYTSEASDRGAVAAIREEVTARATADAAEAAARTTLAVRVNGAEAAINQEAVVRADETGKLSAKWGLKVVAGNKVAGVLLNNDGQESNFTVLVDRFAIAQQAAGGVTKYPFVVGSVAGAPTVGIDGTLVVDGTILARAINVDRLSAITARLGYVNAGQIDISGDGVGGWGYVRSANKWIHDGGWGWVLARHTSGDTFVELNCNGMGLQMQNATGRFRLWGPGFNLQNEGLTINQVDVIDTLNLRGQSVTVPSFAASAGNAVAVNHFVPGGAPLDTFILASTFVSGMSLVTLTVDGIPRWVGAGVAGSTVTGGVQVTLNPGWHTLFFSSLVPAGTGGSSIYALSTRR
ncbi:phage tail tip fiber protein [Variovorax sp. GB1P17]|uniref:phage tail tip fiber protein n=1 Tax=Variovorax sp. GB1P17 TaxID=3443740 RepID=UPI003F4536AD